METCGLPGNANREHLRKQAKELLARARAADPRAVELVAAFHPRAPEPATLRLSDAQLVIARRYGFASWPRMLRHLETVAPYARTPHKAPLGGEPGGADEVADAFLRLACLTYGADDPGRLEQARRLLIEHPGLSRSSIHAAAATGDLAGAEALLARGPALARELGGPHRWEPILYLAYSRVGLPGEAYDPVGVAALLLQHGADPNAGYLWEGLAPPFTALTGAFGGGEDAPNQPPHPRAEALARLLLDHGADPNDSQTLYNRHFSPNDDHLRLLLGYGLGSGDGGVWRQRLAGRLESPREMLEDQLLFAAANDHPGRVELLLAHGVDPDGGGTGHPILRGKRAIELAAANGSTRIVELLEGAGAAPVELDEVDGFLSRCMEGDRERVDALVRADPTLLARAIERAPARVVRAAELGRADVVRLLVRLGWSVDACPGATALHNAAYAGNREVVDALLDLGADPTIRDARFQGTPAGWAEHAHHHDLAAYLDERAGAAAAERADPT